MFCPKCGSILLPKKDRQNRTILGCSCGYTDKETDKATIKEEIIKKDKEVEIIEKDKELETLPKIEAECPKCRHNTAYFWSVQTRAADEPETRFQKCEKCKHTWREYT